MSPTVRERLDRVPALGGALRIQETYRAIRGTSLAASITLYGFLALFSLAVLAVGVLGFVAANQDHVARDLNDQLGLHGEAARLLRETIHQARGDRGLASIVGLVGLAWTGTSLAVVIANAYNAAWDVERRGLVDRAVGLVWLLGAALTIAAGGFATAGWALLPAVFAPLVVVVTLATDFALLAWTSRALPNRRITLRMAWRAALLGAVALEALKVAGAYAVPRIVERSTELYGAVGVAFALLVWLLLFGRLLVYVAIIEARDARQGWSRSSTRTEPTQE